MKIGHRIKTLRIARQIEPVVMADKLNISESTYRRYERNETEPTLSIILKITDVLGIKITDLLDDEISIRFNL